MSYLFLDYYIHLRVARLREFDTLTQCLRKTQNGASDLQGPFPHVLILIPTTLKFLGDRDLHFFSHFFIPSHKHGTRQMVACQ